MLTPTGESWQGRGVLPDQPFWTTGASADESDQATGSLDPLFDVAVHYLESEGL